MGKLTKLKENFKLENIKEETKKALNKFGMDMIKTAAAMGIALTLVGCNWNTVDPKYCEDPKCLEYKQEYTGTHTHDYCNEEGCVIDDSQYHTTHDYCKPCEGNQPKTHGHCTEEGCTKGEVFDDYAKEHGNNHDYCGNKDCIGEDKTSKEHECLYPNNQEKCNAEDCVNHGELFDEGTHNHVCKDHCLDEYVFNGDEHTHDYCDEYGCAAEGNETDNNPHEHCEAEDCKYYKSAYTGEHTHVCKEDCLDKNVFNGNEHTHEYDQCTKCDDEQIDNTCVNGSECEKQGGTGNGDTETTWFKTENIGGESSPYKTCYIDVSEFNEENRDKTQIDQFNLRRNEFQKYINDLGFTDIQLMKFGENNDQANNITTVDNNFDTSVYRIKDYCDDIIKDITKNINISNNKTLNQQQFVNYYKAIKEKAYFDAYSDNADSIIKESYTNAKDNIKTAWTNIHTYHNTTAPIPSIYQEVTDENGNVSEVISPEVITQLNLMLESAAPNTGKDIKFLQNVLNLSWVIDSIDAVHDYTKTETCDYTNNTMEDIISNEITL